MIFFSLKVLVAGGEERKQKKKEVNGHENLENKELQEEEGEEDDGRGNTKETEDEAEIVLS